MSEMYFTYHPKKLIETAKEIAYRHKAVGTLQTLKQGDRLKELIQSLVKIPAKDVPTRAYVLSEEEVMMVAGYLPHNYYNQQLTNLFQIVSLRGNIHVYRTLFRQWQCAYQGKECRDFMAAMIRGKSELCAVLQENHFTESDFLNILAADDPAQALIVLCSKSVGKDGLEGKLKFLGIEDDTPLFNDCIFLFYTCCSAKNYLAAGEEVLRGVIVQYKGKYGGVYLKKFLINFLHVLSMKDLRSFSAIGRKLCSSEFPVGYPGTPKALQYFQDTPDGIYRKYCDWINWIHLYDYFGTDERSRFWENYRFEAVHRYSRSNSIALEFRNCFVVEFLGDAQGPLYFYNKDFYTKHVLALQASETNPKLRSILYNNDESYIERFVHRGWWQAEVSSFLMRHHITERIDW